MADGVLPVAPTRFNDMAALGSQESTGENRINSCKDMFPHSSSYMKKVRGITL